MDTADTKYKQTIKEFYKSEPTPSMQKLEKENKDLKQGAKNAPKPSMHEDFVCSHQSRASKKGRRDSKKLHKFKQQEMILEQERSDQLWLEELQKQQLASEQELIHQLCRKRRCES